MGIKIKLSSRWISLIFFLAILVLWITQTKTIHESWNESTRLASMQALVEHSTWRIDASPYGHQTGDKMLLDGHYYSDKPPLFAAIGAFFYTLMYYGLDATLAIEGCRSDEICVYYWLTVLMVGIPSALMAALFYQLSWRQIRVQSWALGLTLLLCFGTVVWPYSLVLNHHLPAAIVLFIGFYWLFASTPRFYQVFLAGFLVGVAVMFDLTSFFLAFSLFLIVVIYHRKYSLLFTGTALIPLLITLLFNYQITGRILFAYLISEGYNYPGSPWDTTIAGQHPPDNILAYSFRSLVGDNGLLAYSPLLIFAMVGLVQMIIGKNPHSIQQQLRGKSMLIGVGIIGHLLFVFTQTNHFGGDAYGWRFLIPVVPVLYSFTIYLVPVCFSCHRGKLWAVLWGMAVIVSIFSAYQGVRATWHQITPPIYLATSSHFPYITTQINLSLPGYPRAIHPKSNPVRRFESPPVPYPLLVNFNNEVALLGYELPQQRIQPGQDLEIILYWQLLRAGQGDYFAFTHLLDTRQTRLGGLDRCLQEVYPTAFSYPGEVVTDKRQIAVETESSAGLAWVRVGVYQLKNNQIQPLGVVNQAEETSIALGPILVGTSTQLIALADFKPQFGLDATFGEPAEILLRGYDLVESIDQLNLTLYWQNLTPASVNWSTFVHLQDKYGKIVAQKDGQTGNGLFPSSLWQVDEVIADSIRLNLPSEIEPGRYTLVLGLYQADTGQRLFVPGSVDNSFQLTTLRLDKTP